MIFVGIDVAKDKHDCFGACLLIVSLSPWYCGFDSFIIEIIRPGFYLKLDQDL